MRSLRLTISQLLHAITDIEADEGLCDEERDHMLDMLYRDLADARSRLKQMQRAA